MEKMLSVLFLPIRTLFFSFAFNHKCAQVVQMSVSMSRETTWGGKGREWLRKRGRETENRDPGAECCDTGCGSLAALMWGTDVNLIQPSGSCQCLFSVTQSDTSCLRCHLSARPPVGVWGEGAWVCVRVWRGQRWHTAVLMAHKPGPRLLN